MAFSMLGVCIVVMLVGAIIINPPRTIEDTAPGAEGEGRLERVQ